MTLSWKKRASSTDLTSPQYTNQYIFSTLILGLVFSWNWGAAKALDSQIQSCGFRRCVFSCVCFKWVFPKMVVPQNGWFIYNGKPYQNAWFGGTTIFGNTQVMAMFFVWGDVTSKCQASFFVKKMFKQIYSAVWTYFSGDSPLLRLIVSPWIQGNSIFQGETTA